MSEGELYALERERGREIKRKREGERVRKSLECRRALGLQGCVPQTYIE